MTPPLPTDASADFLADLRRMSPTAFARAYGFTRGTIQHWRSLVGLTVPTPHARTTPPLWRDQVRDRLGRVPDRVLAEEVGVSVMSILHWRLSLGISPSQMSPWTQDNRAKLGKVPDRDLADQMGVSAQSVAAARRRVGAPPVAPARAPSPGIDCWALMMDGATDRVIADLLGISRNAAKKRRQKAGLRLRDARPAIVNRDGRIRRAHARGLSTAQIAAEVGCTYRSAQEYLWRLGLKAHRMTTLEQP